MWSENLNIHRNIFGFLFLSYLFIEIFAKQLKGGEKQ